MSMLYRYTTTSILMEDRVDLRHIALSMETDTVLPFTLMAARVQTPGLDS